MMFKTWQVDNSRTRFEGTWLYLGNGRWKFTTNNSDTEIYFTQRGNVMETGRSRFVGKFV